MNHAKHPTRNYDFAPIASILGQYNARGFASGISKLDQALDRALDVATDTTKPLVPHASPELIIGIRSFLQQTIIPIIKSVEGRIATSQQLRAGEVIAKYLQQLEDLKISEAGEWMCDKADISAMYGVPVAEADNWELIDSENEQWKNWQPPKRHAALDSLVSIDEVENIHQVVSSKLLVAPTSKPVFYLDRAERHHLFWIPTVSGQECVIPDTYSLADFLRFHCPHNDAHLAHLNAVTSRGVEAYSDHMDERGFFETVAVHAEWQMFEAAKSDDFVYDLHSQLSLNRQRKMSRQELQDWILNCRGYEFRLRLIRLLGDVSTFSGETFDIAVDQASGITGVDREDSRAEVKKYYHFPGLGAVYTLGYKKLLEAGLNNTQNSFIRNGQVISTWHQF